MELREPVSPSPRRESRQGERLSQELVRNGEPLGILFERMRTALRGGWHQPMIISSSSRSDAGVTMRWT